MKILLLSVHPPQGGGSAYSSQELAWGLRSLGHYVLHISPYKSATLGVEYPGLLWFTADFPAGLSISPEAKSDIDLGRLVAIKDKKAASQAILDLANYLRSKPESLPPPQLPQPIEVLYQYESMLQKLQFQPGSQSELDFVQK